MISQADIARDLSVSQPLVSQVLNGRRQYCDAKLYVRIWRHALKHDYRGRGILPSAVPAELLAAPSRRKKQPR